MSKNNTTNLKGKVFWIVLAIVVTTFNLWLYASKVSEPDVQLQEDTNNEQKLNKVRTLAKDFMKLENTLYSKKTYSENIAKIERITTKEFFKEYYTKDGSNVLGIADEIIDYKYNLDTVVTEKSLDGYVVIIYATEVYSDIAYPFTAIIKFNEDMLVTRLDKIPHKF